LGNDILIAKKTMPDISSLLPRYIIGADRCVSFPRPELTAARL
jgi:hypothetical protein